MVIGKRMPGVGGMEVNILLCCASGMSTSLLMLKMERAAAEKGIDCNITAVPVDAVKHHIAKADVILLGPQVQHLSVSLKEECAVMGIPVAVINRLEYGTWDGEKVLDMAIAYMKEMNSEA